MTGCLVVKPIPAAPAGHSPDGHLVAAWAEPSRRVALAKALLLVRLALGHCAERQQALLRRARGGAYD